MTVKLFPDDDNDSQYHNSPNHVQLTTRIIDCNSAIHACLQHSRVVMIKTKILQFFREKTVRGLMCRDGKGH